MITGTPSYIPESLMGRTLGKYQLMEIIGRGGMGVVFKVWDTLEERFKAIKMVPPEVASSPLAFEDLKREISMASSIIHPNVVKVLSLEAQDGQYFIVMEYIEGESLEKKMALAEDRRLKEEEVIRIMKKAAEGIIEAHARQVLHRDMKPRNIMETDTGEVKILDFGVSHRLTRSLTELTGKDFSGTWPYMAPEQLSNRFGRENQQVDIWAFGVTMYHLLAGEVPFRSREQIVDFKEKPFPLHHISPKTSRIIMKCLEKDRTKRYQDMTQVLRDLETVKIAGDKKSREKSTGEGIKNPGPFLEWPRAAAGAIVILAGIFLYYSWNLNHTFTYNFESRAGDPASKEPMSPARQEYEDYLRQAETAAQRSDFAAALAFLENAKKMSSTPRVVNRILEISTVGRSQQVKTDFQELRAVINSPVPPEQKREKTLRFLDKYKDLPPLLQPEQDAEILDMISRIQAYWDQLQVKTILWADLPEDIIALFYEKIRRIEIPGLPAGVRVLGQVNIRFQVSEKGSFYPQQIDDSGLKITGRDQAPTIIKNMLENHLKTFAVSPPRDKNGAAVRVKDWDVTFKVGTFQDKIILLHEG